jgi:NitT/TauT family transport system ATP-binding protein
LKISPLEAATECARITIGEKTLAEPVIQAKGLNLVFQTADAPVHALKDVDLTVGQGDFVSFIGPSGCGKTTFLRVIADLEQPTGGSITVNCVTPHQARMNRSYGYVFQAAGLYPWRSIAGNIRLPLEIMGYSRAEQDERAARTLELVGLTGFEKKFPWQLSGGMQQRASIARALAFDADLLLMDEPFGALDEIVRDHLNEHPHCRDEPAPRPRNRHHRLAPAARTAAGHPRKPGVPGDRPPGAGRTAGRA